jgi:hypothetical protein
MSKVIQAEKPEGPIQVGRTPCMSCPYRKDVPSGIWDETEYDLLPRFDGDIVEQIEAGATYLFYCHQQDGKLCAGWVGCHSTDAIAIRANAHRLDPAVFDYESPVPLFESGKAARDHGMRDIEHPGVEAVTAISKVTRVQKARNGRFLPVEEET